MPTTSALVIGGSLAGMCAARVLSDFVDRVTVERDAHPSAPEFDRAFRKLATYTICSPEGCASLKASSPASQPGCVSAERYR